MVAGNTFEWSGPMVWELFLLADDLQPNVNVKPM